MTETNELNIRILEAAIFASEEPVPEKALARLLPDDADLGAALKELKAHYSDRGVRLVRTGKSWAFRTATDLGQYLNREVEVRRKLSRAAVETLAIAAYHQPVTRAEIEEIRGVGLSKGTLDLLFEQGWITPRGRRKTPGRPMTWGTTDAFLDHFGLESLTDLPGMEDLKAAGLLDARPAIEAYSIHGEMKERGEEAEQELPLEAAGELEDEGFEEEDVLALEEAIEEEPLYPNDGDSHDGEPAAEDPSEDPSEDPDNGNPDTEPGPEQSAGQAAETRAEL